MSKAETCSCWYVLLDTWYNNTVVFDAYYISRPSTVDIAYLPDEEVKDLSVPRNPRKQ
jgi:hypothetical protein